MTTGILPAYPVETSTQHFLGLSKRELFATMAMQGILAGEVYAGWKFSSIAEESVSMADELIKALNKDSIQHSTEIT